MNLINCWSIWGQTHRSKHKLSHSEKTKQKTKGTYHKVLAFNIYKAAIIFRSIHQLSAQSTHEHRTETFSIFPFFLFFFLIWYTPFTETPPTSLFLEPLSQWASSNTWTTLCGTDRVTWNHTWYRPRITQPLSLPSIYIPLITFQPNNSVIRYRTQVPKKPRSALHHWKFS